jgi:two-component system chemotaxis response regulator CheB
MLKTKFTDELNKVIVIGTSAGGINALKPLLSSLKKDFKHPIIIVIHRLKNVKSHLVSVLQTFCTLKVKEAEEKEFLQAGYVYVAPSNYHLMLETDLYFSLIVDELVNFSRPSIDVSFVSFSEVLKDKLLGIVLTGANADGAIGAKAIFENGGQVWVQEPETAYVQTMPKAALEQVPKAYVYPLKKIMRALQTL